VQHGNVIGNGMEGLKDKGAIVGVGETKYWLWLILDSRVLGNTVRHKFC